LTAGTADTRPRLLRGRNRSGTTAQAAGTTGATDAAKSADSAYTAVTAAAAVAEEHSAGSAVTACPSGASDPAGGTGVAVSAATAGAPECVTPATARSVYGRTSIPTGAAQSAEATHSAGPSGAARASVAHQQAAAATITPDSAGAATSAESTAGASCASVTTVAAPGETTESPRIATESSDTTRAGAASPVTAGATRAPEGVSAVGPPRATQTPCASRTTIGTARPAGTSCAARSGTRFHGRGASRATSVATADSRAAGGTRATGTAGGVAYSVDVGSVAAWSGLPRRGGVDAGCAGQAGTALAAVATGAEPVGVAAGTAVSGVAAVEPRQRGATLAARTTVTEQLPTGPTMAARRARSSQPAETAIADQTRGPAGTTGLARRAGSAIAAVAEQQAARPAGGSGSGQPVGTVSDQRTSQQRLGRRVDHIQRELQRRRIGGLRGSE